MEKNKSKIIPLLSSNICFQVGVHYDGTNLSQLTLSWAELIPDRRDILANRQLPFPFWAKTVYTLVDVLKVPTGLKGKRFSAIITTLQTINEPHHEKAHL